MSLAKWAGNDLSGMLVSYHQLLLTMRAKEFHSNLGYGIVEFAEATIREANGETGSSADQEVEISLQAITQPEEPIPHLARYFYLPRYSGNGNLQLLKSWRQEVQDVRGGHRYLTQGIPSKVAS